MSMGTVLSSLRGTYGRTGDMRFSVLDKRRALEAMELMGVAAIRHRSFGGLSSGERRRFLVARALVHQPEILVLDEPLTALDFAASRHLIVTLRQLLRKGRTLVWVTHHPGEIPPEIDRVVLLKDGRLFADGRKREVLADRVLGRLYDVDLKVRWSDGWCDVRFL
jgi:iron complex transport system ATP-binding protein